ncbi:MAG TPA: arginine--tRNA ligase, partial [Porphyromonadaceae bacterium]|nr:arginine--tRNA ligase [Porphyromonadaceae bacterium]
MNIENILQTAIISAIKELYSVDVNASQITLQKTKKEFKGHFTLVTFPLLKISKKNPEQTAQEIGMYLADKSPVVSEFNVIKGFLNLTIASKVWLDLLENIDKNPEFGFTPVANDAPLFMVEYSSPNTNKPLHLGHIRNNLLGHSLCEILKANGKRVVKTNIVNDRGIHICKSMLAWQKWGDGETPASSGKKGDHLIGKYYVLFDKKYKAELADLQAAGLSREQAEAQSVLMEEAREMLRQWEANDAQTVNLWKMMNGWVYAGFDETYEKLGVSFDKIY